MGLFDSIQATPRNGLLGLLSDTLSGAYDAAGRIPERIDAGRIKGLLNLLGVPAVAATTDRMSYGEPLTNAGKANVPLLRPETADAAMAVAPVAAKWPREVAGSVLGLLGIADTGALSKAATVWHGSPHKFDAFDASKIGTGEGAQAYGHGLYLAEAPAVAEGYRRGGHVNPYVLLDGEGILNWALGRRDAVAKMPIEQQRALRLVIDHKDIAQAKRSALMDGMTKEAAYIDELSSAGRLAPGDPGNLYKVDLPDSAISRMLDWDKPLSQQAPEVQRAIKKAATVQSDGAGGFEAKLGNFMGTGSTAEDALANLLGHEATGGTIYSGLKWHPTSGPQGNAAGLIGPGKTDSSSLLRQAGIPGIRYLDGGSRGAGAGTSNYVVFPGEEGLLKILERNGQTLP